MAGSRIFDVGCGSGRDLHQLLSQGYDAFGCEPAQALRYEALQAYPELKNRVFSHELPFPPEADFGLLYQGVLCSAVLMHLPEDLLSGGVASLHRLLIAGGRLLVSVSGNRPGLDAEWRENNGRLFTAISREKLLEVTNKAFFRLLKEWKSSDSLDRAGITWQTYLFESF